MNSIASFNAPKRQTGEIGFYGLPHSAIRNQGLAEFPGRQTFDGGNSFSLFNDQIWRQPNETSPHRLPIQNFNLFLRQPSWVTIFSGTKNIPYASRLQKLADLNKNSILSLRLSDKKYWSSRPNFNASFSVEKSGNVFPIW